MMFVLDAQQIRLVRSDWISDIRGIVSQSCYFSFCFFPPAGPEPIPRGHFRHHPEDAGGDVSCALSVHVPAGEAGDVMAAHRTCSHRERSGH